MKGDRFIVGFYTPLRYPGGKRKLYGLISAIIKKNKLSGCVYAEPYAGGAGLALSLLFDGVVNSLMLNDFSQPVFAFWHSVLYSTDAICEKINTTPICIDEWHKQKHIFQNPKNASLLDLGYATFFLNRTNRSGILKAGVIGGKAQSGEWKLDARFARDNLVLRIKKIAEKRDRITVTCLDALDFIEQNKEYFNEHESLVYFDPPYYEKGAALYDNYYKQEDHADVSNYIQALPLNWVVSYDNHPAIRDLYKKCTSMTYSFCYTAQSKKLGSEFLTVSQNLRLPELNLMNTRKGSPIYDIKATIPA